MFCPTSDSNDHFSRGSLNDTLGLTIEELDKMTATAILKARGRVI